jgi:RimJ/RimL family protein N-acetyltransferase
MNFIYGNKTNPEVNKFLCEFVGQMVFGQPNDFGPCGSLGICEEKDIVAGVVFHGWQPEYGVIEISAAAVNPSWFCKRSIREIMKICFEQHGCQQIVSRMATDNDRAIKIYEFLCFKKILLPNMRGKGKNEYLMILTADEWRENKMNRINRIN